MSVPKLTFPAKFGWAVGELGIATYIGITMAYMLFYLTQALAISPAWAGLALLLPRLWDAAIDPFVGAVSDRTHSRFGRRRPYLLVGALTFGVAFALIFQTPATASEPVKIACVIGLYIVTSTAFTFYDVPYSSMAAEMTTDYRERTSLTGFKMVAARMGILIAVIGAPLLFSRGATLAEGFATMGIVLGAWMVVTGLVAFFATANAPQILHTPEPFDLRGEYRALAGNRPFTILFSAFLLQNLALGASSTALIYVIVFVMGAGPTMVGPLIATSAVTSMLATPLWIMAARRFGKRPTYFVGASIMAITSLPALWLPHGFAYLLFPVLLLSGIGDAATQLSPNAMVPDTVEYDEHRTGQRREGAIFGTWAFCRKLGMAAGAFLVSLLLAQFGFVGGNVAAQNESAMTGIRIAASLVPAALWIGAMLVMVKYGLTEARFDELKREVEARRQAQATT